MGYFDGQVRLVKIRVEAPVTPDELEATLNESVGEPFLKRVLAGVFVGFQKAHDYCAANLAAPEAENLEPHLRRALIEGYMRDAASLHTDLRAAAVPVSGSPWNHTEIRGGAILLTASAVQRGSAAWLTAPSSERHMRAPRNSPSCPKIS